MNFPLTPGELAFWFFVLVVFSLAGFMLYDNYKQDQKNTK